MRPRRTPAATTRRYRRGVALVAASAVVALSTLLPVTASAAASGSTLLDPGQQLAVSVSGPMHDAAAIATFVVPAQRSVWLGLQLRSTGSGKGYRARARIQADGTVAVGFSRVVNGSETILGSKPTGLHVSRGDRLYVQGRVTGDNPVQLAVRAWRVGEARPAWQATSSDSSGSRITSTGPTLLWSYLSGSASGPAPISYADASSSPVTTSSAPTPAPAPTASPSPTASATLPASGTGKPSAATTGVPAGTSLKRHDGDITVTRDGTVLDRMDIHGFVTVRARNVRITNSIVRGGYASGHATGLITDYGYAGLVIENVDVQAEHPSVYFDGIKGNNFTARRVHVVGNVDSVKIHGDNVTVQSSLLENTRYYASDPAQNGKPTHNDNIQILQGSNLVVTGNTIRGATNFAILGGAEQNNVGLVVTGNWLDGGWCTVKLQTKNGWSEKATVSHNQFGPNRHVASCAFTAYPAVNLTAVGNVFEQDGRPVPVLRVVS